MYPNDIFVNGADTSKEDLATKKETSPVAGGANTSSGHYISISTAHPVPSLGETPLGQEQEQSALSSWISYRPIGFHGAGSTTIGFKSLNTLSLQHAY